MPRRRLLLPHAPPIPDKIDKIHYLESEVQAILALEDGRVFRGKGFGATKECTGEVVFNTSITGYQEIFTDPSYAGQIVVLTNPEIGNYGTTPEDEESKRPYIEGLIVREFSPLASNWRSHQVADEYLERHAIPVLAEIDTRALVRHLRDRGVMRGVISTDTKLSEAELVAKARTIPKMEGRDLASVVSTTESYPWTAGPIPDAGRKVQIEVPPPTFKVVAYDFGIKHNILRNLVATGCQVTVVPAKTSAEDVLGMKPDGVFLSNGPGDPEPVTYAQKNIQRLLGRVPIFGICLGHQLTGIALGGKTFKLKFGHHGGNHPVKNLLTGKVEITAHNHNFAVDPDSLKPSEVELTHVDLNDNTLEGLRHRNYPLFSVQYHPEAAPGPHDSNYLFTEFARLMTEWKASGK
jgi:carbamoyl-phosphate synthase small subunit